MVALDAFFPAIRKHISGPLELMMKQAVLDAVITFCRESLSCRDAVNFKEVIPDIAYRLTEVKGLKCIKRLRVLDITQPTRHWPGEMLMVGRDFTAKSANDITFKHAFHHVTVDFAVEPRRDAHDVPDLLYDDHQDVIAMGALEDLFIMPGKPWTDPQRSHHFGVRFVEGYRRAFREALDNSPITAFHNPVRQHEFF